MREVTFGDFAKLANKRGSVSRVRRRQIVDKINAAMGWKLA